MIIGEANNGDGVRDKSNRLKPQPPSSNGFNTFIIRHSSPFSNQPDPIIPILTTHTYTHSIYSLKQRINKQFLPFIIHLHAFFPNWSFILSTFDSRLYFCRIGRRFSQYFVSMLNNNGENCLYFWSVFCIFLAFVFVFYLSISIFLSDCSLSSASSIKNVNSMCKEYYRFSLFFLIPDQPYYIHIC